jgi:hypothetical protein
MRVITLLGSQNNMTHNKERTYTINLPGRKDMRTTTYPLHGNTVGGGMKHRGKMRTQNKIKINVDVFTHELGADLKNTS